MILIPNIFDSLPTCDSHRKILIWKLDQNSNCINYIIVINTLRSEQKQNTFPQLTISYKFFLMEIVFSFKFHWSVFLRVQMTMSQHWLRQMSCCQLVNKPSFEPILTPWYHRSSLGRNELNMLINRISNSDHHQISNIKCTLVGNYIAGNSDVVGAAPVGAAPTTSSLLT